MLDVPPPEAPDARDHLADLAHAYALDAVPLVERHRIDQRLRSEGGGISDEFRHTVRVVREAMARLSVLDAQPPPPALESKILTAIDAKRRHRRISHGVNSLTSARHSRLRRLGWIAVAATVAATVAIAGGIIGQRLDGDHHPAVTAEQILRQPDTRTTTSAVGSGGTLIAHISAELDAATVAFESAAPAPVGQDYQLWLIDPDGTPRSAGVLPVLPQPGAPHVTEFDGSGQLAITIEPDGGSSAPTGTILAAITLG